MLEVVFIVIMFQFLGFCSKIEALHTFTIGGSCSPSCKVILLTNGERKISACLEVSKQSLAVRCKDVSMLGF